MKQWSERTKKLFRYGAGTLALVAVVGALSIGTVAVVHAASRSLPSSPTYVAIGDSVAAGAGLPRVASPTAKDSICGRSSISYPQLLAAKLTTSVSNLACSGAKDSNGIISAQSVSGITIPSQLDRAFVHGTPNLITLTIGANDINWTQFIGKCYTATCGSEQTKLNYAKDLSASAALLTKFQGTLAYTLHQIKDRSGNNTPPKVLITGYYYPVTNTSCLNGTVRDKELQWINLETDNLNKAIRQTVDATSKVSSWFKGTYNFATYVPISFSGHGICSADPWVQGLSDPAPVHPNAKGAAEIAAALAAQAK